MKLPITYLAERLKDNLEDTGSEAETEEYLVGRPKFLTDEIVIKNGGLYLCGEEPPGQIRMEPGAFLVSRESGYHTLCIKPEKSMLEVSNRIHQIFDETENWLTRMKTCGQENGTIEMFLQIAREYLPHYMAVMDPDFLILAHCLSDAESNQDIHSETGYLKIDIVNTLRQDACYDAVKNCKHAFLYVGRGLKNRFLCANLLEGGVYRGRINVREDSERPFQSWEGFFLEQVRDALLPIFLKNSRIQVYSKKQRGFVQILMEGKENYQDELYWFLKDIGWEEQGRYYCACIQMELVDMEKDDSLYYAKELEYILKDTVCVPVGHRIYLLHACFGYKGGQRTFWEEMNYFIRESNLRIGVSREFSDIRKTCLARSQAQIALDYGKRRFPQQWKYQFDDVALSYLAQCMTCELPAEGVCHPVFPMLREHERIDGLNLYGTFVCFVEQDFNMVQTAKKLFIHRGTLIYRLNKIQELTGVRWDTWKEKMYLSMSVWLLSDSFHRGGSEE